jgi:hypothetical protein
VFLDRPRRREAAGGQLALWLRDAFPSAVRSYQPLTFYPALAYGVDNDRIGSAKFIGVGNRGLSGIVYRIKVACGRSKQSWHNAWGGRFSKIAGPKFHARKIKRQRPISNDKSSVENFKLKHRPSVDQGGGKRLGHQFCWRIVTPAGVRTSLVRWFRFGATRRGDDKTAPAGFSTDFLKNLPEAYPSTYAGSGVQLSI